MPNKPRQFEIGNIYHIIKRGVDGREIFLKDQDCSRFILGLEFFNNEKHIDLWSLVKGDSLNIAEGPQRSLREKLEKQRKMAGKPIVELITFTLMPNHFHLIIREIINKGISYYMQKIGGFSKYFNSQYHRRGTLFESTYKCIEIKNDAHLFAAFNYVHTNAVELIEPLWKKQQVKNPDKAISFLKNEHKWSGYRDCIGIPTFPNVIKRDFLLDFFGGYKAKASSSPTRANEVSEASRRDKVSSPLADARAGEKNCKKEVENWIRFKANNYIQKKLFNPKDFE